jgi:GNAT superfamily N-acetyltransferase
MIEALPHDYPAAWAVDAVLSDGGTVHIRPIRPNDAPAHRAFFARQSKESIHFRFFSSKRELSDAEVEHFTTVDYHDRMAFAAFIRDEMVAVGRYERLAASDRAEVAFAVVDEHQGRGIASLLLEYLAAYAPDNGITQFTADTLTENRRMLDVFKATRLHRRTRER